MSKEGAILSEDIDSKEKKALSEKKPAKAPKKKKDPKDKLYKPKHGMLTLNSSPHDFKETSVPKVMWAVVMALAPAAVMSVYYFGLPAAYLIGACVISSLLTEYAVNWMKGEETTIKDGSVAITGLLLALTLPPTLSITSAILGSVFAVAIGKHVFGGLGYNIFNPALIGRAFLQASFPVAMTTWVNPFSDFDGVSSATPLGLFKFEKVPSDLFPLLTGNTGGSLGETCAIAIIAGGLFLVIKKYADWRIPLSYLGTVFLFGGVFWLADSSGYPDPVFQLLSGGLMLGAFFMATDMVTSPITPLGAWIFGIGAGILVVIIRFFGGLPEGIMYSILFMNALTPLINRYTRPKFLGEARK